LSFAAVGVPVPVPVTIVFILPARARSPAACSKFALPAAFCSG